jgi:hypothetical protein
MLSGRVWFIAQSWSAGVIVWSMQCKSFASKMTSAKTYAYSRHDVSNFSNVSPLSKNRDFLLALLCRGNNFHFCDFCPLVPAIWWCAIRIVNIFLSDNSVVPAIDEPVPGIYVCGLHNIQHSVYTFWRVPVVVFDCLLLALTLWTCIQRVQSLRGFCHSRNQIWRVLLTDSLLYFSMYVVTSSSLASLILNKPLKDGADIYIEWSIVAHPSCMSWKHNILNCRLCPWQTRWRKLPQGFPVAATCVIGARLILNLRKAYYFPISMDLTTIAN